MTRGPHPWNPDDETRSRFDFSTHGERAETDGRESPDPETAARLADPAGSGARPMGAGRAGLDSDPSDSEESDSEESGHDGARHEGSRSSKSDPARSVPAGTEREPIGPRAPDLGVVVDFYGKPGCHLCDVARPVVEAVAADEGATVAEHDILDDPAVTEKYGEYIPVVLINGRQQFTWRVDERMLRRAIRAAKRGGRGWFGGRIMRRRRP
ncbi:MAG: glutaredoxin family protein [Pseudoclavibacter sp.]